MIAYVAMTLKNKRVVVIGGAKGIGFAIAELAAADGADVVVSAPSITWRSRRATGAGRCTRRCANSILIKRVTD